MYHIYILYSAHADKYYIGYSLDPRARLHQHLNNGGEKFTGKYKDWQLVAVFEVSPDKKEAIAIERFFKLQKSRKLIEKMLEEDFVGTGILAQLVRVPHMRD
jgi:predicted GIY-YIG superfamily endonuclease